MVLTIVIVNWNTREDLLSCLESIQANLGGVPSEVRIVDNGSKDGSIEAVRQRYPWAITVANGRNEGFARAANQGLKEMKGRYALLLNPDTRLKRGGIEPLISFMETHPEAGAAGPQLLNADGSKQNSIANFPSLTTEFLNKRLLRWLLPGRFPGKERRYTGPVEVDSVIGACMMVRGDALRQVGLLDESYFLFLEETDWCYRSKKAGWKIYHVPQAEIVHFQGKSAGAEKAKARVEYYRSRYTFFKKHRGPLQWVILLLGGWIRLSVELLGMAIICVATLFTIKKWRRRLSIYAYLLWWHLRLCPKGMGLREG